MSRASTRRGCPGSLASAAASGSKSTPERASPGRQTTGSAGNERRPYSRTCSLRPSCAATTWLVETLILEIDRPRSIPDRAAVQIRLDQELRAAAEAHPVDLQILHHAL